MLEAATKRKMIAVAKQSILLADHSKIGQVSFCKVADLHEIDHCILDSAVQGSFTRGLEAMDVGFTIV
ncbi:HTH-type transcriptional repressor GlcR [compost metagenome]